MCKAKVAETQRSRMPWHLAGTPLVEHLPGKKYRPAPPLHPASPPNPNDNSISPSSHWHAFALSLFNIQYLLCHYSIFNIHTHEYCHVQETN